MSAYSGTFENSQNEPRQRGCGGMRWRPVELVAMILGFAFFWPLGLAVLGWKIYQRKGGHFAQMLHEEWGDRWSSAWQSKFEEKVARHCDWRGFGRSTGNSAFDDWRNAELARLEEERRKLAAAEREFADFLSNLRRAKDREEFDRFMQERRNRPVDPGTTTA